MEPSPAPAPKTDQRSEPGMGRVVGLYLLDKTENCLLDSVLGQNGRFTAMCGSVGEDFSISGWPVVVKVKAEVTQEELAQHLRDLAEAVENGFFMAVDQDR
jgi:hypothetical protein